MSAISLILERDLSILLSHPLIMSVICLGYMFLAELISCVSFFAKYFVASVFSVLEAFCHTRIRSLILLMIQGLC